MAYKHGFSSDKIEKCGTYDSCNNVTYKIIVRNVTNYSVSLSMMNIFTTRNVFIILGKTLYLGMVISFGHVVKRLITIPVVL